MQDSQRFRPEWRISAWLAVRRWDVRDGEASNEDKPPARKEKPPAPPATAGKPPAPSPKTWIEFVLADQRDKPIPNERYKIKVTDGSVREGRLDKHGKVRIKNIDPGDCTISFPDLDAKEWAAA